MARNIRQALSDEHIEEAVREGIYGREQIAARFGITESAARRAEPVIRAIARERERNGGRPPRRGKVPPLNPGGMTPKGRLRELKGSKKGDAYPRLLAVQMRISELSAALSTVDMAAYGIDEVSIWRVSDIEDDLISLAFWTDRTLGAITGWLGDAEVRKKIRTLRNTSGRTAEEAKAMTALADRLEKKLRNRLTASSPAPAR